MFSCSMTRTGRHVATWFSACAVALGLSGMALAQTYPTKPIRLVVPYPAGAGTDAVSRLVAQHLSPRLGQPVVVENRAGAGGNIGSEFVAKSAPDGYTLLVATPGPIAVGRSLYKSLRYEPLNDLAPVILLNESPIVMLTGPKLRAGSVQDVVKIARQKPEALNASIAATGSINHLVTEMFKYEAKAPFTSIPYKGGAQAVTDAIGGQVDMVFVAVSSVSSYIANGQLTALAVASRSRSPLIPNVPTMAEVGFPTIVGSQWNGISVPAGTPPAIINRLNTEIAAVLEMPEVRQRFATMGMSPVGGSAQAFQNFLKAESARWAEVITRANITED